MPAPQLADPGRIIAHRGASQICPENTIAAFRQAVEQGARWIEFDVVLLGDGVPVVHHDGVFGRCTNVTGPLSDWTANDLATIEAGGWFGPRFLGEPLPRLDAVLTLIQNLDLHANLEMKPHDLAPGVLARAVADALQANPEAGARILVSSFDGGELNHLRKIMPDLPLAMLHEAPPPHWLRELEDLDAGALHMDYRFLSQSLCVKAQEAGIDLRVYTINTPKLIEPFRDYGLTGLFTDHPPLFLDDPAWREWAQSSV